MKKLTLYIAAITLLSLNALQAAARTYTSETLNYQIVYHWGLVWKHAGDAKLSIKKTSNGYYSSLTAKTRSWAETFYPVRDTLKTWMDNNFCPSKYHKITHEKSYYAVDKINFWQQYGVTHANCERIRKKSNTTIKLSSPGDAYDMLSVFYALRNLSYEKMSTGSTWKTVVFSGKYKETLTITYHGIKKIELRDKSKHNAHHITFSFTQNGRKNSSSDINAWLSSDESRKPLMIKGSLPVGEVRVYLAQ